MELKQEMSVQEFIQLAEGRKNILLLIKLLFMAAEARNHRKVYVILDMIMHYHPDVNQQHLMNEVRVTNFGRQMFWSVK